MVSQRLNVGVQVVIAMLPVCYGGLVLAALPNTWQWALGIGLVLLLVLVICGSFSYPLQTFWPVFPGAFLILACTAVLIQGAFDQLPLTRQPTELVAMYLIGALYVGWGIRATWRAYSAFA